MDDNKKKIAGAVIGLALVGLLLWYFIFSKQTKGDSGTQKTKLPPPPNNPNVQSGGQTQQTPTQQLTQIIYVDPNVVAREGSYSAQLKALQEHLIKNWGKNLGSFGADGFLGNFTYTAIESISPNVGKDVRANKRLAKSQYDILIKYFPSDSTSNPSPTPTPTLGNVGSVNSRGVLVNYLNKNTTKTNDAFGGWYDASLAEWVNAVKAGKNEFYCSTCYTKKTYPTYKK